jgi:hypothetical protein
MKINNIYIILQPLFKNYKWSRSWNPGPASSSSSSLGYCLAWFRSLKLPSTQSESPLALIPLAPKYHVPFKACSQLWHNIFHFSFFIFRSGLSDILINCNRIGECLLYTEVHALSKTYFGLHYTLSRQYNASFYSSNEGCGIRFLVFMCAEHRI